MNYIEEIRALWRAKITSKEDFDKASQAMLNFGYEVQYITKELQNTSTIRVIQMYGKKWPWFVLRDMVREVVGVYEAPTSVIESLRREGYMGLDFPHISLDDRSMVAYTPDMQSGAADKKLRTGIGRLLRRHFSNLTDAEVESLEASHRGELDGTYLIATEIADIERVYTTMFGDSGCMRHHKKDFGHTKYHPSAVYSSPGFGVAYLQQPEGKVTARTVIYDNANDPKDKRYVRLYGDVSLKRRLERAGYKCSGLAGTKLLKLDDPAQPGLTVMPYLDPAGGRESVTKHINRVQAMAAMDGMVYLLSSEQRDNLNRAGIRHGGSPETTSGHTAVTEVDGSALKRYCLITGDNASILDTKFTRYYKDGMFGWAKESAKPTNTYMLEAVVDGKRNYYSMTYEDYNANRMGGYEYFNNKETAQYLGFEQKSVRYYGENAEYCSSLITGHAPVMTAVDGATRVDFEEVGGLLEDDVIVVHTSENESFNVHESHVKELKKAGFVSVGLSRGKKRMSVPGNSILVKTLSGRSALVGYNNVVQVAAGWMAASEAQKFTFGGMESYLLPNEPIVLAQDIKDRIKGLFRNALDVKACFVRTTRNHVTLEIGTQHYRGHALRKGEGDVIAQNFDYGACLTYEQFTAMVDCDVTSLGRVERLVFELTKFMFETATEELAERKRQQEGDQEVPLLQLPTVAAMPSPQPAFLPPQADFQQLHAIDGTVVTLDVPVRVLTF